MVVLQQPVRHCALKPFSHKGPESNPPVRVIAANLLYEDGLTKVHKRRKVELINLPAEIPQKLGGCSLHQGLVTNDKVCLLAA